MAILNKTSFLYIEDDDIHAKQIQDLLVEEFEVHRFSSLSENDEDLLKLMSTHPDLQIIVVDLLLPGSNRNGWDIIKEILWPLDRRAYFIIFSRLAKEQSQVYLNDLPPHLVFVQKEYENKEIQSGSLTKECLNNLATVIRNCGDYSMPMIIPVLMSHEGFLAEFVDFASCQPHYSDEWIRNSLLFVTEAIERSNAVLSALSQATVAYAKVGKPALNIGIGVFGSCGRLEMKKDSDIEFSVVYNGEGKDEPVARSFWYRTRAAVNSLGLDCEGKGKEPVVNESLERDNIPTGYVPILDKNKLIKNEEKLRKDQGLRDRHWQILTEFRPIFNAPYIFNTKKEILSAQFEGILDVRLIAGSSYLKDLIEQFLKDTEPKSKTIVDDSEKMMKIMIYRVFSVMAFKIAVFHYLLTGKGDLSDDKSLKSFLDAISSPSLIKMIRLHKFLNKCDIDREVVDTLEGLILDYLQVVSMYLQIGDSEELIRKLPQVKQILEKYKKMAQLFMDTQKFRAIPDEARRIMDPSVFNNLLSL